MLLLSIHYPLLNVPYHWHWHTEHNNDKREICSHSDLEAAPVCPVFGACARRCLRELALAGILSTVQIQNVTQKLAALDYTAGSLAPPK